MEIDNKKTAQLNRWKDDGLLKSIKSEICLKTVKTSPDDATYHILECFPGSLQVVQVGSAALNSRVVQFLERCPAERTMALSDAQRQH